MIPVAIEKARQLSEKYTPQHNKLQSRNQRNQSIYADIIANKSLYHILKCKHDF